jgi:hypothetical protein
MIEIDKIHCIKNGKGFEGKKLPLTELDLKDHVHGKLILRPNESDEIFNFSYFGSEDVCIGQWFGFLLELKKISELNDHKTVSYPYPDQGDPDLCFKFDKDRVSIKTTWFTDDDWSEVQDFSEFSVARDQFDLFVDAAIEAIETAVLSGSNANGPAWIARYR